MITLRAMKAIITLKAIVKVSMKNTIMINMIDIPMVLKEINTIDVIFLGFKEKLLYVYIREAMANLRTCSRCKCTIDETYFSINRKKNIIKHVILVGIGIRRKY